MDDKEFEAAFSPVSEEEKKKKRRTRIIWIAIFILVNGGVILYTALDEFGGKHPAPLGYSLQLSNILLIAGGLGCALLALAVETLKYVIMMRSLGVKVSVRAAFETAALGKYYDNITPSGVGGQPFQIYHLYKHGYDPGASAAMPLAGFLNMQMAFVFMAIVLFILFGSVIDTAAVKVPAYIGLVFYSFVPALIMIFIISHNTAVKIVSFFVRLAGKLKLIKDVQQKTDSIVKTLGDYHESILLLGKRKGTLVKLFLLSLLYQAAICSIPFFVLHAFGGYGAFHEILTMTFFIYAAITIIPTPGNSGAAEGSFYLIFSRLEPSGLFWAMVIWRLICYYFFILIGLLVYAYNALLSYLHKKKVKKC